ncbi:MAG: restriction endonuclease subunit S, partial [Ruminococcus sp.]|nr:restriction endonuclease subunit S [Ruminococcus sp.]
MNNIKLVDVCKKESSNIKQSDLANNNGDYPIYGASGLIKKVDFYVQDKPYIGIVIDGAGVGRVMKLPAYSSVIGTMQYIIPNDDIDVSYLAYAMEHMNLSKYYMGAAIP